MMKNMFVNLKRLLSCASFLWVIPSFLFAAEPLKNQTDDKRIYTLMRKAAAYPVTDVYACLSGVRIAAVLYADLLRQGALESEEYTKFSIETRLGFAANNGTPVDVNVFWLSFDLQRANGATLQELTSNDGREYAKQVALWEVITCKFNSSIPAFSKTGPIPKAEAIQLVERMIGEMMQ